MRQKKEHGRGNTIDRGTYWQHRYRDQITKAYKSEMSRREADKKFDAWRKMLDDAAAVTAVTGPIITVRSLLGKWCEQQEDSGKAQLETAVPMVRRYLMKSWLADLDANKITVADAEKYRDDRRKKYAEEGVFKTHRKTKPAPDTLNKDIVYLNGALALLRPEPRFLKVEPLDKGPKSIRQGWLTEEKYRALMQMLTVFEKPLWCFAYYTGMRQGELRKLRRDWAKNAAKTHTIFVPAYADGERVVKNAKAHTVPLYMPEMLQYVLWALDNGDPKCPFLFQKDGKQITKGAVYYWYKKAAKDLEIPEVLFHDLRRTAVRNMVKAGIPREKAMKIANMKTPTIFTRYNVIEEAEQEAENRAAGDAMFSFFEELRRSEPATDLYRISTDPNVKQTTEAADRRKLN